MRQSKQFSFRAIIGCALVLFALLAPRTAGFAAQETNLSFLNPVIWLLLHKSAHVPADAAQASRFLARSTFGPTLAGIDRLMKMGSYEAWLEDQFGQPPSFHLDWMRDRLPGIAWRTYCDLVHTAKRDGWWDIAVHGPDQLRQRVAFALSEIMVVSQYGPLINEPDGLASFYDVLVRNAFGNFRTLLEEVTLHPMMGKYLSYLGNAKANPDTGSHPDENYAREVMQLFTIGLYRLNRDGTTINDPQTGLPLPTYNQADIREMARVFTGWSDDNGGYFFVGEGDNTHHARTSPMVSFPEYHDTGAKHILDTDFPAGQSAEQDLKQALDLLFNHPNVGPFIARRLIQRLVTSNPSPAYIDRVAAAFNDNGHGVRGDMKAVVRAILLDPEALAGPEQDPHTFGKVREPLLCISHLWRAFQAQNRECARRGEDENSPVYHYNCFHFEAARSFLEQNAAHESLTVFNWFTPDDGPADLKDLQLVSPERMVLGIDGLHSLLLSFILETYTYETYEVAAHLDVSAEIRDLERGDYDAMLDRLNLLLLGGSMDDGLRQVLHDYIATNNGPDVDRDFLARNIIALIFSSSQYAVQR
jgi:hypothetical protein